MLTARQEKVFAFLVAHFQEHPWSPSYREIGAPFAASTSAVARDLGALEKRGLIRRLPNRACSIEIVGPAPAPAARCNVDNCRAPTWGPPVALLLPLIAPKPSQ